MNRNLKGLERMILGGLFLAGTLPASAMRLDLAYWAPDRGTPYRWFEGAKDLQSFFTDGYLAAGYLYLYVRNDTPAARTATEFALNGRPLEELRQELQVIWWRLLPTPLPPGRVGEVMIRLRSPLTETARVRVGFDDGSSVEATVAPQPPPLRIETVGFTAARDQAFLVVERLRNVPLQLARMWLDGKEVTARCRFLDPTFATGVAPLLLSLGKPLEYGSYHTYRVATTEGMAVACCVRTYDGWVPLGSYGYGTYEEYARNGCNGHNNFGRHGPRDLEVHATLGMRAVMILGDQAPPDYMVGHPGVFAYGPVDEPDVQDYFRAQELPSDRRIGFTAMEMERRLQLYRTADPHHLTILTLDLTYKPANYYIYGPLADVVNPDCYPISLGADASMVREVVETARYGAGPRPVTFTFQGCFEEPLEAAELAARRFPRPPFAGEERLMLYYAIGAGARGLFNYIHCSEKWGNGKVMSHGSGEYPDVWQAIGRVYRELDRVAPLLAQAHPTKLATSRAGKLTLSTLLAGPEALLLVCINEDYIQEAQAFRVRPQEEVALDVPVLPWLVPQRAWRVTEAGFVPLKVRREPRRLRIQLDRLEVAELLLVAADPKILQPLQDRYAARQREVGAGLLALWRQEQAREAVALNARRRLEGEFADWMVLGRGIEAYGIQEPRLWNPQKEDFWGLEFGQNEAREDHDRGAEWQVTVPAERAGQEFAIFAMGGAWGQPAVFTVTDPQGREIFRQQTAARSSGELIALKATFPTAGDYMVRFLQGGPGPKGGRIARAIYVIPVDQNPPQGEGNGP
jgi:hypothetical protein